MPATLSDREYAILQKYDKSERFLNPSFVDSIPWHDVANHSLDHRFVPVLVYMRDVEAFTDIYYKALLKTPTGRDPIIRRFMDRWWEEEKLHATLLDRFLNEAGIPTGEKWFAEARAGIPKRYRVTSGVSTRLAQMVGHRFSAVHMTWGAINELSTLQGYKRLWETAAHPVLEHLLRGIAREEASHIFFYRSIAQIKLAESKYSQQLTRFIMKHFWSPVGQGTKPAADTNYVIRTLFQGENGLDVIRTHINGSIAKLPGFKSFTGVSDRLERVLATTTP